MNVLPALLTLLVQSPARPADPVHSALAGLNERWAQALPDLDVGAVALAVVDGGEIAHRFTWGRRDPEGPAGVTGDTIFYIASATKPYVALAVMQLVEQGRVDLDAPVRSYLPRFRLADPEASGRITVRDLLDHSAGLNSLPIVLLDAYTGEITEDRYYHFLADVRPLGRPSYSNLHFTLAGRIIEAVTGQPWREYLAEHVFAPAGMTRTSGHASWMYAQDDVALPAVPGPGGMVRSRQRKTDATMHAAGGLGTSVDDFARWALVQLGRGRIGDARLLGEDSVEEMFAPQTEVADSGLIGQVEGFGLGWQRGTYRDQLLLGHGGGYVGSGSWVGFLPELDIGLAILVTGGEGAGVTLRLLATDVLERFLSDDAIEDSLPDARRRVATARARRESVDEARPARFEPTLPAAAHAGPWTSTDLGTLHFDVAAGTARLGDLGFVVLAGDGGADSFQLDTDGMGLPGRFVVEGDAVSAVELGEFADGPARFTRSDPGPARASPSSTPQSRTRSRD